MKTVAIWLLVVFALSVIPVESGAKVPHADKLLHFSLYAITCALFFSMLIKGRPFKKALALSVLLSAGYGLLIEIAQIYAPSRSFSASDIAANTLGALAAAGYLAAKRRKK